MPKPLPNGAWEPTPGPQDFAEAHRLLDKGYVQRSRRYRHLSRALDDGLHPTHFRELDREVTIDVFAAFRKLGGNCYNEVAGLTLDATLQRLRAYEGAKALLRWLNREFDDGFTPTMKPMPDFPSSKHRRE